jgi:hypothetical protein
MSDMMETCKSDTSMMSSMCKTMMENQQMKDMMQKKMGENKEQACYRKIINKTTRRCH